MFWIILKSSIDTTVPKCYKCIYLSPCENLLLFDVGVPFSSPLERSWKMFITIITIQYIFPELLRNIIFLHFLSVHIPCTEFWMCPNLLCLHPLQKCLPFHFTWALTWKKSLMLTALLWKLLGYSLFPHRHGRQRMVNTYFAND